MTIKRKTKLIIEDEPKIKLTSKMKITLNEGNLDHANELKKTTPKVKTIYQIKTTK